jgi:biopolymer transport protein ExbD
MKCLLSVCLAVLAETAIVAMGGSGQAPALQKGISVQMATSSNAVPMPEADNENAWIITVTTDGRIYFGPDRVTTEGLAEQMKIRPRNRAARLYIKADAGAPFSSVRQALSAARVDLFDDVVLLTSQPVAAQTGAIVPPTIVTQTIVPPKGLDVWIGSEAGPNPLTVQISSEQESIILKVNHEAVAPAELQGRLGRLFDNRAGRIVVLRASGQVPYAQVVHAIDACRGAGASRVSMTVSPDV